MHKVGSILNSQHFNVNNVDKDILNNVSNVKTDKDVALDNLLALYGNKPQGIAKIIAEKLNDLNNLNFHIKTAKLNSPHILFEVLSITLEADREGKIKKSRAQYYIGVLKRKGIKW